MGILLTLDAAGNILDREPIPGPDQIQTEQQAVQRGAAAEPGSVLQPAAAVPPAYVRKSGSRT